MLDDTRYPKGCNQKISSKAISQTLYKTVRQSFKWVHKLWHSRFCDFFFCQIPLFSNFCKEFSFSVNVLQQKKNKSSTELKYFNTVKTEYLTILEACRHPTCVEDLRPCKKWVLPVFFKSQVFSELGWGDSLS